MTMQRLSLIERLPSLVTCTSISAQYRFRQQYRKESPYRKLRLEEVR
jgi:hypothetical protein